MITSAGLLAFLALGTVAVNAARVDVRHAGEELSSVDETVFDALEADSHHGTSGLAAPENSDLYLGEELPACGTMSVYQSLFATLKVHICIGEKGDARDATSVYLCESESAQPAILQFEAVGGDLIKGYYISIYSNPEYKAKPSYGSGWYLGASGSAGDITNDWKEFKVIARKGKEAAAIWDPVTEKTKVGPTVQLITHLKLVSNPDKSAKKSEGRFWTGPHTKRDETVRTQNPVSAYVGLTTETKYARPVYVVESDKCK